MNNTEKLLKKPEELGVLWCVGVEPAYIYVNGKKTDKIGGYKYTILVPDLGMMQFKVKVAGAQRFEIDGNYVAVELLGSAFVPYVSSNGRVAFSAKAEDICIVAYP